MRACDNIDLNYFQWPSIRHTYTETNINTVIVCVLKITKAIRGPDSRGSRRNYPNIITLSFLFFLVFFYLFNQFSLYNFVNPKWSNLIQVGIDHPLPLWRLANFTLTFIKIAIRTSIWQSQNNLIFYFYFSVTPHSLHYAIVSQCVRPMNKMFQCGKSSYCVTKIKNVMN